MSALVCLRRAQVPAEILIGYVEEMVEKQSALVQKFAQTWDAVSTQEPYPDTPYWKMAARFGQLELESHLRWGAETLAELRKIAKQQQNPTESKKEKSHAGK